jgi:hypothetical protein
MYTIRTGRHLDRTRMPAPPRKRMHGVFLLMCFFGFVYGIVVPKVGDDAAASTVTTTARP